MKRVVLFLIAIVAFTASVKAYDFSFTYQGKKLYYTITNSSLHQVSVVNPTTNGSYYIYIFGDVVIPDSVIYNNNTYAVISVGDNAFSNCPGLTSVSIPASVTGIGSQVLGGCTGLTSIIVDTANTHYDSRDNCNAIIQTELNVLIQGCNTTVIPNTVASIGNEAFYGFNGLTSISIPNSVTSIGYDAFYGCSSLTSVNYTGTIAQWCNIFFYTPSSNPIYYSHSLCINNTPITNLIIPDGVTSIRGNAFAGCSSLISVIIPNSVTSIGGNAFAGCSSLISVIIPNSVTSIGCNAFRNCSGNMEVFIKAITPPSLCNYQAFYSSGYSCYSLIVPRGSLESYRNANQWIDLQDSIFVDSCQMTLVNANPTLGTAAIRDTNVMTLLCPYKEARWFDSYGVAEHYHTQWTWEPSNKKDSSSVELFFKEREETFTLTCDFVVDTYYVNVVANDITRGSVSGGGEYAYGTPCIAVAAAYAGYTFHSWSNGETANPYVFAPVEDMTLTAIFLAPGEGIGSVDGMDAKVNCDRGRIVVEGAEGNALTLFDINGRLLERKTESGERRTFDVPASGAYLIKIGNHPARKVVVIR